MWLWSERDCAFSEMLHLLPQVSVERLNIQQRRPSFLNLEGEFWYFSTWNISDKCDRCGRLCRANFEHITGAETWKRSIHRRHVDQVS